MLSVSAYKRTEVIGQGKFGVVYKGCNKHTKKVVAIKVLDLDTKYDEVVDVEQEIQFLSDLKNAPNVTHYYGSFLVDTKLWIIMDYCAGGSMRTLLKAGVFEERYIGVIVREVLLALLLVHKLGVIHRDIKAANILVTNEGHVQVCDFGVAAQLTANAHKRTTIAGTPFWMAPEVIREGDQYNAKADIWSLGITVYEFATGNPPYLEKGALWAMTMIEKLTPPRLEGREYPPALKECIALCLDENPDERPSADELLRCKLVKQYKSTPTGVLKELILRYLLWRDRNSLRELVFVAADDDERTDDQLHVKWDFDSLSSREYIIENDIHLEPDMFELDEAHTMTAEPTLHYNSATRINDTITNGYTIGHLGTNSSRVRTEELAKTASTANAVPKSLLSLFEEESEPEESPFLGSGSTFDVPRIPPLAGAEPLLVNSPTIEIPDMESLSRIGSVLALASQVNLTRARQASIATGVSTSVTTLPSQSHHEAFPLLNKPPALTHSQSASAALDSRHNSPTGASRHRKKTISNTYSTPLASEPSAPHTPPYVGDHPPRDTPSPITAPNGLPYDGHTTSPSKSMRALHQSNNPMLQPINFKLNLDGTPVKSTTSLQSSTSSASASTASTSATAVSAAAPLNASATTATNSTRAKKERPSLRIQMPVPSTSLNHLAALTGEEADRKLDNVNQFGINPALVSNFTSMTPVTEKDSELGEIPESKEAADANLAAARQAQQKKLAQLNGPKTAPVNGNGFARTASTSMLATATSTTSASGTLNAGTAAAAKVVKFPTIPALSGDLFVDSTPKAKIVHELEAMIRLFSQGLEAVESSL